MPHFREDCSLRRSYCLAGQRCSPSSHPAQSSASMRQELQHLCPQHPLPQGTQIRQSVLSHLSETNVALVHYHLMLRADSLEKPRCWERLRAGNRG